ncbi:MAG: efflux transporter periplasmic adaptor subunit [Alteromonadaceae bacterium]|nr:efflux transporter periplasmic adaptor subunit [Alteromonadaceae bacterium]|tara:strand:- start:13691 stop:14872 length:1182 start_codon:yes stop_codon:yes gene_type:complete
MARKTRLLFQFLLVILIIAAPAYALMTIFSEASEDEGVLLSPVRRGDIEVTIVATGQLEPKRYVEVGAQVSGQVEVIHVEEGDRVKKGDLLVEIDATVFRTQVQTTEANLENKRAQLEQLKAERELALLRAKRNQQLHEQDAVSADEVYSSETNVKVLDSRIRASVAQIKADEASLAGDKATLGFAKIYAPIDGTVATIAVRQGQTLNANQNAPTLLQISDLQTMTVRAEVSEADVGKILPAMPVYFTTLGDTQTRYHSAVRQVLPTPTEVNDVVLYQVLIDIENTTGKLMDAMTTQVFFVQQQQQDALLVPLAAVKGPPARPFVMVVSEDGQQRRQVEVGVKNRTVAEITAGLQAGEQVVIGVRSANATRGQRQQAGQPPGMPSGGGRRGGF